MKKQSILEEYNYFIFDVDRTIAPDNGVITPSIMGRLRALIEHANVAIVTSRGIHEGMELLAQPFFQHQSQYGLYFFTTSAAQAYAHDSMTGGLLKLYDKAKGDANYQAFHQNFRKSLKENHIEIVDDVHFDPTETDRKVQIHDRMAQVTLFFSHTKLRHEFEGILHTFGVHPARHGRNSLHVLPSGVDKRIAIEYLQQDDSKRFLVFADGFYDDPTSNNRGNDLSLTQFPKEHVTCINVGRHTPKAGSGVFYDPKTQVFEAEYTDFLLEKILAGCSFDDLGLVSFID